MALLSDDQKLIQDTARSFLAEEGSIAKQLRRARDANCPDGFRHALWKQFGELGLVDHEFGGHKFRADLGIAQHFGSQV